MIRRLAPIAMVLAALLGFAAPAGATSTTFALTAGSLSISSPSSVNLGSAATGSATITSALGTVTVTDNRGSTLGTWTASVSSSDFTTGGATSNETIVKGQIDYWSGAATASSGTGTFTPGQTLSANKQALSVSRTAFSAAALVGNNSESWDPTLVVNVPAAAVAGTYTGTITHSVA